MSQSANEYNKKRNFDITPESQADELQRAIQKNQALQFVVQKHDARVLYYDSRLEFDGVLKSWAIPKGPSIDRTNKRMAIREVPL